MRRRLAWLIALPAVLAGSQAAHALAYRLAFPDVSLRVHVLTLTGHGYLAQLPLALGIAAAVGLVGFATAALDTARGHHVRALPPVAFALLPPLAFALQELLELSLHTGTFAWQAFTAPTFLPGFALQLPFALLAYVAARLLLRAAVRLGRLLAPAPRAAAVLTFASLSNVVAPAVQSRRAPARAPPFAVGI